LHFNYKGSILTVIQGTFIIFPATQGSQEGLQIIRDEVAQGHLQLPEVTESQLQMNSRELMRTQHSGNQTFFSS